MESERMRGMDSMMYHQDTYLVAEMSWTFSLYKKELECQKDDASQAWKQKIAAMKYQTSYFLGETMNVLGQKELRRQVLRR